MCSAVGAECDLVGNPVGNQVGDLVCSTMRDPEHDPVVDLLGGPTHLLGDPGGDPMCGHGGDQRVARQVTSRMTP